MDSLTTRQRDVLALIDRYINRLHSQQAGSLHLDLVAPIRDKKLNDIRVLADNLINALDEWEKIKK